jgi:hypothetical protein
MAVGGAAVKIGPFNIPYLGNRLPVAVSSNPHLDNLYMEETSSTAVVEPKEKSQQEWVGGNPLCVVVHHLHSAPLIWPSGGFACSYKCILPFVTSAAFYCSAIASATVLLYAALVRVQLCA